LYREEEHPERIFPRDLAARETAKILRAYKRGQEKQKLGGNTISV